MAGKYRNKPRDFLKNARIPRASFIREIYLSIFLEPLFP